MPKSCNLDSFGPEFEQLLLRADKEFFQGKDEYTVQFDDPKIAHSLRFRIYVYFQALRGSPDRPDLTAMCSGLSIRVAGSALVFYRRGEDKESEALRNALGLEKGFADGPSTHGVVTAPTVLHNNLSQLAAIRAGYEKKPVK